MEILINIKSQEECRPFYQFYIIILIMLNTIGFLINIYLIIF